jgi:hypothetical protein
MAPKSSPCLFSPVAPTGIGVVAAALLLVLYSTDSIGIKVYVVSIETYALGMGQGCLETLEFLF